MSTNFNFSLSGYIPSSSFDFNVEASAFIFNVLAGTSNNFVAIWADPTTSLTLGKIYAAAPDAFSIVDLSNNSLYDAYTQTRKGRGNETLSSNDIVDINIA